ncbi:MAG: membrane protein insertion efficiency factor YidD [Treponema sp.]|nr:membrane protein insertion efficiency factor YidD [Treponema sp.]
MQKSWLVKEVRHLLTASLTFLIRFYQVCISPLFPPCCKYTPSCSCYALESIQKHGPVKGLYIAVKRILRCNPFSKGGYDPVP